MARGLADCCGIWGEGDGLQLRDSWHSSLSKPSADGFQNCDRFFNVWHLWPALEQPNAQIKYIPFMSNLFWPTLAQGGFSVFARCPHEVTLRISCFCTLWLINVTKNDLVRV